MTTIWFLDNFIHVNKLSFVAHLLSWENKSLLNSDRKIAVGQEEEESCTGRRINYLRPSEKNSFIGSGIFYKARPHSDCNINTIGRISSFGPVSAFRSCLWPEQCVHQFIVPQGMETRPLMMDIVPVKCQSFLGVMRRYQAIVVSHCASFPDAHPGPSRSTTVRIFFHGID